MVDLYLDKGCISLLLPTWPKLQVVWTTWLLATGNLGNIKKNYNLSYTRENGKGNAQIKLTKKVNGILYVSNVSDIW